MYHHHHHCHHLNRCYCGYCYDCGRYVQGWAKPYSPWPYQPYPYPYGPYWSTASQDAAISSSVPDKHKYYSMNNNAQHSNHSHGHDII